MEHFGYVAHREMQLQIPVDYGVFVIAVPDAVAVGVLRPAAAAPVFIFYHEQALHIETLDGGGYFARSRVLWGGAPNEARFLFREDQFRRLRQKFQPQVFVFDGYGRGYGFAVAVTVHGHIPAFPFPRFAGYEEEKANQE
jgi:hypothetical protein